MFETDIVADRPTTTAVLERARTAKATENRAAADILIAAVDWAELHPADSIDDAAVLARGNDSALAIAGPGAPLVAEFAIAEFAAALHLPTRVGADQIGEAVELCHRLPKVWARVVKVELPAWRARRIARSTIRLTHEAATYVDAQIAHYAHRVGPAETDRLIDDAIARFMPETADAEADRAADARHLTIGTNTVSFAGTTWVSGELNLADALDLETAVATGAATQAAAGSTETLDVRRSIALGDLARGQSSLELTREVVLHVHLSPDTATARLESNGRHLVTKDQVRDWCGAPASRVTIKPVVDLNDHVHVSQYEIPDRLRDHVDERDLTCVFPWCTRTARACDHDHITPYDEGGPTSSDNIAALCRRHHRLKTHGGWTYTMIEPGSYLWASPHGLSYLRDHTGTRDLSPTPPRP